MKNLILIFLFFLASLPNKAEVNVFKYPIKTNQIDSIKKQIPQPEILKGRFHQVKKITGIKRDFISDGKFIFIDKKGIYWETEKPFWTAYLFSKNQIIEITEDKKKKIISNENNQFIKEFSKIFQSVFSGKYDELNKYFQIYFYSNNNTWILGLKPKNNALGDIMTEIIISGELQTQGMIFKEKNGDKTKIEFKDLSSGSIKLNNEEKELFEN